MLLCLPTPQYEAASIRCCAMRVTHTSLRLSPVNTLKEECQLCAPCNNCAKVKPHVHMSIRRMPGTICALRCAAMQVDSDLGRYPLSAAPQHIKHVPQLTGNQLHLQLRLLIANKSISSLQPNIFTEEHFQTYIRAVNIWHVRSADWSRE
jgi:hypothetical protein